MWGVVGGVAFVVACSGGSGGPTGGGSGTSGGTSGSNGGGGGGGGGGSVDSPLLGTWDVVSMFGKKQHTAVLTIEPQKLELSWKDFRVTIDASGDVPKISFDDGVVDGDIVVTHLDEPMDVGHVPYALGGTWSFHGTRTDRCTAKVVANAATIECANLGDPLRRVFSDYDIYEEKFLGKGTTIAQRGPKLPSDFGELGGEWTVSAPRSSCKVVIEGKTFTAECKDGRPGQQDTSSLTLTFGDGIASGAMNAGELSARRR